MLLTISNSTDLTYHLCCDRSVIDYYFEKGYFNYKLFDNSFVLIHFNHIDPEDKIFRHLYESRYLKLSNISDIYHKKIDDSDLIIITLSEAIQFLYNVTPPVFKHQLDIELNSMKAFHRLLAINLITTSKPQTGNYASSIFKKICHVEPFETGFKISDSLKASISIIKENRYDTMDLPVLYVEYASMDISEIMQIDLSTFPSIKGMIQGIIQCDNDKHKEYIIRLFENNSIDILDAVKVSDKLYVEFMTTVNRSSNQNEIDISVANLIQTNYMRFFNSKRF